MYTVIVSDAEYYCPEKGTLELKEGTGYSRRKVESHKTVQECFDSMSKWGSEWCMYPSCIIENDEGEEVWSNILLHDTCACCGHERYEGIESGLYLMRKADGTKLFPEIV